MIQEILTWITVGMAFLYTLYSIWKTMFTSKSSVCGGGCPSCEAKDLLIKDISSAKKSYFNGIKPLKQP